jgi:hypothetical protein
VLADGAEEPVAEDRHRLDHAAADEVRVRVGEVRRDGEEPAERDRLLPEDLQGHGVPGAGVPPHQHRRLVRRARRMQIVAGVAAQPVGQQVLLNARQGGDALAVPGQPAVAQRHRLPVGQQPVHRDPDVPELAGHPGRAAYHLPALDHAAAEPGPHYQRNGGAPCRVGPEVGVMGIQRRDVRVIVVDHGQGEPGLQGGADVEAAPGRIDEIHRAPRRDDPIRAGRPRRVQAHRPDRVTRDPGQAEHVREGLGERLDRHRRPFSDPAGRLDQLVHQEPPGGIEHGRVDGPAAVVEADNGLLALTRHPRLPRPAERTAARARPGAWRPSRGPGRVFSGSIICLNTVMAREKTCWRP